jgi:hypothetical protein
MTGECSSSTLTKSSDAVGSSEIWLCDQEGGYAKAASSVIGRPSAMPTCGEDSSIVSSIEIDSRRLEEVIAADEDGGSHSTAESGVYANAAPLIVCVCCCSGC